MQFSRICLPSLSYYRGLTNCFFSILFDIPTCKVARVQCVEFLGTSGRKTGHVFLFSTVFIGCVSFFRHRHSYVYCKKGIWSFVGGIAERMDETGGRARTRVPRTRRGGDRVTLDAKRMGRDGPRWPSLRVRLISGTSDNVRITVTRGWTPPLLRMGGGKEVTHETVDALRWIDTCARVHGYRSDFGGPGGSKSCRNSYEPVALLLFCLHRSYPHILTVSVFFFLPRVFATPVPPPRRFRPSRSFAAAAAAAPTPFSDSEMSSKTGRSTRRLIGTLRIHTHAHTHTYICAR